MQSNNENNRLSVLYSVGLLDTPIEERFERITRLLCRVMNVPIAGISIIDSDREWFKSIQGINITETPRYNSFGNYVLETKDKLVVTDTLSDKRFKDSHLVANDPSIIFYAGYPLTILGEAIIGTIFVCDIKARDISTSDIQLLEDFAETTASEIKSRLLRDLVNSNNLKA